MKPKLDREDKVLLIIALIFFIAFSVTLTIGFYIYPDYNFETYYFLICLSLAIFFLLTSLSFCVKKYSERKKNKDNF